MKEEKKILGITFSPSYLGTILSLIKYKTN